MRLLQYPLSPVDCIGVFSMPSTTMKKCKILRRQSSRSVKRSAKEFLPKRLLLFRRLLKTAQGDFFVLCDSEGKLRCCNWVQHENRVVQELRSHWYRDSTLIIEESLTDSATFPQTESAAQALQRYFSNAESRHQQKELDAVSTVYPPSASKFLVDVWTALRHSVRAGSITTYRDLGVLSGLGPKVSRAVGRAMSLNPVPVVVPCHRVVSSDHRLCGYSCGLKLKSWLLHHEHACLKNCECCSEQTN